MGVSAALSRRVATMRDAFARSAFDSLCMLAPRSCMVFASSARGSRTVASSPQMRTSSRSRPTTTTLSGPSPKNVTTSPDRSPSSPCAYPVRPE